MENKLEAALNDLILQNKTLSSSVNFFSDLGYYHINFVYESLLLMISTPALPSPHTPCKVYA